MSIDQADEEAAAGRYERRLALAVTASRLCWIGVALVFGYALLSPLTVWAVEWRYGANLVEVARLLGWAAVVKAVLALAVSVRALSRYFLQVAGTRLPRPSEFKRTESLVASTATAMGVRVPTIKVNDREEGPPWVTRRWRRHILVVSKDLERLCAQRRQVAQAVIAHELGHIRQRDAALWFLHFTVAGPLFDVLLPIEAIALLVAVPRYFLLGHDLAGFPSWFVANATALLVMLFVSNSVRRARTESEILADLGARMQVGDAPWRRAIEMLPSSDLQRQRMERADEEPVDGGLE